MQPVSFFNTVSCLEFMLCNLYCCVELSSLLQMYKDYIIILEKNGFSGTLPFILQLFWSAVGTNNVRARDYFFQQMTRIGTFPVHTHRSSHQLPPFAPSKDIQAASAQLVMFRLRHTQSSLCQGQYFVGVRLCCTVANREVNTCTFIATRFTTEHITV